jgi:acetoin utilization deacetylase AcuC-like enzyme
MNTAYCYDKRYLEHTYPGHPENANRLTAIVENLADVQLLDRLDQIDVRPASEEEVARVHSHSYIQQVRKVAERGGGHLDSDTYVVTGSFSAALLAAGGLIALTEAVLDRRVKNGFALVRPPGHHALTSRGMGFCIFNNIAIAARHALARREIDRVMIVDFDVHHGNGTQDTFDADPGVLFVSIHQFPHYPGTGRIHEIGRGPGAGTTVNIPLPAGVGDKGYSQVLEEIIWPLAKRYDPQLLLVSAGFDAHWTDPLAMMQLSLSGYALVARELVAIANEICDGRLLFTLEGGYDPLVLSRAVENSFYALLGDPTSVDPTGPSPYDETPVRNRLTEVKAAHGIA